MVIALLLSSVVGVKLTITVCWQWSATMVSDYYYQMITCVASFQHELVNNGLYCLSRLHHYPIGTVPPTTFCQAIEMV